MWCSRGSDADRDFSNTERQLNNSKEKIARCSEKEKNASKMLGDTIKELKKWKVKTKKEITPNSSPLNAYSMFKNSGPSSNAEQSGASMTYYSETEPTLSAPLLEGR